MTPCEADREARDVCVRTISRPPPSELCVDRHYLRCASQGALRPKAHGRSSVPAHARTALISAGGPIQVAIPQPVTTSSVLFDPDFAPEPPATVRVRPQPSGAGVGLGVCRLARGCGTTASLHTASFVRLWPWGAARCNPARDDAGRSVAGASSGACPDRQTAGRGGSVRVHHPRHGIGTRSLAPGSRTSVE